MLLNLLSNLLRIEDFETGFLSFGQCEIKSFEAMPFRGSILMRCFSFELPQFPLPASQFAFQSVAK